MGGAGGAQRPFLRVFEPKLRQSGPLPSSRPISCTQMAAKPAVALMSATFVYIRKGSTVTPLSLIYKVYSS